MIQDQNLAKALSKILQRSERHVDKIKLVDTFVDVGVLPQLVNRNNQILNGRRGTGKTHVLKVLKTELESEENTVVTYIDCRTLGSTTQFSDLSLPIEKRCLALFRDILNPIYNDILEHIIDHPNDDSEKTLEYLDELLSTITEPVKIFRQDTETKEVQTEEGRKKSNSFSFSPSNTKYSYSSSSEDTKAETTQKTYRVREEDKIVFPSLYSSLNSTLSSADIDLYILIDEWSSIPRDIQPYLAEFLKRGVLPLNRVIIKIATLEHRTKFNIADSSPIIGFEKGADISTVLDLDDYYVYDRNPEGITDLYAKILLNHLNVDLPPDYLKENHRIESGKNLASKLFTQRSTLMELSRAAEGVVRDLINIFRIAFFDARKRGRETIDKRAILDASRQWFEQDKSQDMDEQMEKVLRRIVDEVIGNKKARSFLLHRDLEKNIVIQKLFDARLLHHMQRGYADKDNPGVRYNIYSLDYGTYVDLIGTSKEPQIDLFPQDEDELDIVVPFDDKRSIRRIILDEKLLRN